MKKDGKECQVLISNENIRLYKLNKFLQCE